MCPSITQLANNRQLSCSASVITQDACKCGMPLLECSHLSATSAVCLYRLSETNQRLSFLLLLIGLSEEAVRQQTLSFLEPLADKAQNTAYLSTADINMPRHRLGLLGCHNQLLVDVCCHLCPATLHLLLRFHVYFASDMRVCCIILG